MVHVVSWHSLALLACPSSSSIARSSLARLNLALPLFLVVYIVMHAIISMLCISWCSSIPFFFLVVCVLLSRELYYMAEDVGG